jgi:hypothetical protein
MSSLFCLFFNNYPTAHGGREHERDGG